jgi:antitoxin (DNA-binding transcriptional repressor) of toxin-antitoxin stability system
MDQEEPVAIITPVERWQDFGAALNALSRYAFREAERELTRDRKRRNKADQRGREAAQKESAPLLEQKSA